MKKGLGKIGDYLVAIYNFLKKHLGWASAASFLLFSSTQFLDIYNQINDKMGFFGQLFQIDDLLNKVDEVTQGSSLSMPFSQVFSAMGGVAVVNIILNNFGIMLGLWVFWTAFTFFFRLLTTPKVMGGTPLG